MHNAQDRLVGETTARAVPWAHAETHSYDAAGNATTFRNASGLAYNSDDQRASNIYDGNGAPTMYSSVVLAYDPENRLTSYNNNAVSMTYNGDGLRMAETAAGQGTYFVYDGSDPVCELDASTGAVTAVNDFGANGLFARYSAAAGNATYYYTFDAQGNVAQRLTPSGIVSTDAYDAWGGYATTAPTPDPFKYNGQWGYYTDINTGLILCTNRYYDPAQGHWLTRDPISFAGGINLYGYCGDGPAGWADPSGLAGGDNDDAGDLSWGQLWSHAFHSGSQGLFGQHASAPSDWISRVGNWLNNAQDRAIDLLTGLQFGRGGVYALKDPETGNVVYVGRSNNLTSRKGDWRRNSATERYKFEPLQKTDSYAEQRGLEEHYFDEFDPELNVRNPISRTNPNMEKYMSAARKFLSKCPEEE